MAEYKSQIKNLNGQKFGVNKQSGSPEDKQDNRKMIEAEKRRIQQKRSSNNAIKSGKLPYSPPNK